ncbi:phosphatase PAP2 family protein [Vibrio sp. ZSDZ34]|jgi:undecaprenyl-diphosphatase|uniref:undecaprenyl-diphosphate phosphatase n=1 Tax=Vibrio gelatinilyticus TaxID=2893468 RepID=A0A9X1WB86_9VIBR|nr:phosphatase PAP2 family protein [Vibrio gelatinilyticus]MCJ2375938.1 phosphatase PAP2 family protein [Vibrio gelatinilyticus]
MEAITRLDLAFSLFCLRHRFRHPVAKISRWVSRTGDGHFYAVLVLMIWRLDHHYGEDFTTCVLLAFAFELPIYWLAKNSIKRRRPQEISPFVEPFITPSDRYSLPSGHTAAAFLMATLISFFYPNFMLLSFVWAALIGSARILLGVHFLTDVLVGALLGVLSAKLALTYTIV